MDNYKKAKAYLAAVAQDAAPVDLAAHDRRYHPNGYKPGDPCAVREAMRKVDEADTLSKEDLVAANRAEAAHLYTTNFPLWLKNFAADLRRLSEDQFRETFRKWDNWDAGRMTSPMRAVLAEQERRERANPDFYAAYSGEMA